MRIGVGLPSAKAMDMAKSVIRKKWARFMRVFGLQSIKPAKLPIVALKVPRKPGLKPDFPASRS
jgi:hypothetical protein